MEDSDSDVDDEEYAAAAADGEEGYIDREG